MKLRHIKSALHHNTVVTGKTKLSMENIISFKEVLDKAWDALMHASNIAEALGFDDYKDQLREAEKIALDVDHQKVNDLLLRSARKVVKDSGIKKGANIDGCELVRVSDVEHAPSNQPGVFISVNFILNKRQVHCSLVSSESHVYCLISGDENVPMYGKAQEETVFPRGDWPDLSGVIEQLKKQV